MFPISKTSFAEGPGEFWENRVREVRKDSDFSKIFATKEAFMTSVRTYFDEPDIGLADIAWDLVSMELGEDSL